MNHWGRGGKDYRLRKALNGVYKGAVLGGPFAGMRYVDQSVGSGWFPKILGRYESELHETVYQIIREGYATIVDIGCAEGYYAVGMALKCPAAQIVAFDIDADAQRLCSQLAHENHVADRVTVRGGCSANALNGLAGLERVVVICDCEGAELDFLDANKVAWLRQADILVELHDFIIPGLKETLLRRFELTHSCTILDSKEPRIGSEPAFASLSAADQIHGLGERWPMMQWAWLRRLRGLDQIPAPQKQ